MNMAVFLKIFCLFVLAAGTAASRLEETELRMPGVQPQQADKYLCHSMRLDEDDTHYLVGFTPHGSMHTAHHMLLFACTEPGSEYPVWDCGEMKDESGGSEFPPGPTCATGTQIIYAWAKDAPELKLPQGVGFKVGKDTGINYLVLQVHYMHKMPKPDHSGLTLHSTTQTMEKTAATLLMGAGGVMEPHTKNEHYDSACKIEDDVELHPFAFRTHTHSHGKVVSGWKVELDNNGEDIEWQLIGKHDPQQPQMFYPVENDKMVIRKGDVIAARCTMDNEGDEPVAVGATGADEMCNFYMMYWVQGDNILSDNTCYSPGPPLYYWERDAGMKKVPEKETETV